MTKRKQLEFLRLGDPVRRVCRSRISRSLAHHSRPVGRERRETRGERFSSAGVSAKKRERRKRDEKKNEAQLRETVKEEYELKEVPSRRGVGGESLSLSFSL